MEEISRRDILIWLNSLGINNRSIGILMEVFPDLKEILNTSSKTLMGITSIKKNFLLKILENRDILSIKNTIKGLEEKGIRVITILDENYPLSLINIYDQPYVLYQKGHIKNQDKLSIGIVGARKSTPYGRWACEKFTKELVNMGVTIVSGLALGIDAVAHKTAIDNGGRTIAILGNGLDEIYPRRNSFLYEQIVNHGAILTEFPLGTMPLAFNFPQRNRIISGLSLGVIVIEAKEKSGSLITAHHALDQGKSVFSLPGNINSIYSGGTNKLIKDGAIPLLEIDDILNEINELKELNIENKMQDIDFTQLSSTEISIVNVIKNGPIHCDMIAYKIGMPISNVASTLTILEIKGIINEIGNQIFVIN